MDALGGGAGGAAVKQLKRLKKNTFLWNRENENKGVWYLSSDFAFYAATYYPAVLKA